MKQENFSKEIPCPACLNREGKFVGKKNGHSIFYCRRCMTLYSRNDGDAPPAFDYEDYYEGHDNSTPEFAARRLDEIVKSFESFRQNNRLLDVGCGAGSMLEAGLKNNWRAEGIEVSKSGVDYLQSKGFKVFFGFLQDAKFPDNHFDVITAVEILEHIPEPQNILKEIARILRPGGIFWATTPHSKGASARLLGTRWSTIAPPEHIHLFSAKGLKLLLEKSGFNKINIQTQGVNPFEIIHVLKNGDSNNNKEEKKFDRNQTGFQLNAYLSESPGKKLIKNSVNSLLSLTRLGDSLKIWAQK